MQDSNNVTSARKFKSGDIVKIVEAAATFHHFGVVDEMEEIFGTEQVISNDEEYGDEGGYEINGYTWHEDDLELVTDLPKKKIYTQKDILALIESIAQEFDSEWNGDSDTYEESLVYNEVTEIIRSYKADYE